MTLYPAAFERLQAMLEALEPEIKNMTGQSPKFVRDQIDRAAKYGERIFITPRQIAWLEDLYAKHVGSLDALPTAEPSERENRADVLGDAREAFEAKKATTGSLSVNPAKFKGFKPALRAEDAADDEVPF
jgi:hypothetical protein